MRQEIKQRKLHRDNTWELGHRDKHVFRNWEWGASRTASEVAGKCEQSSPVSIHQHLRNKQNQNTLHKTTADKTAAAGAKVYEYIVSHHEDYFFTKLTVVLIETNEQEFVLLVVAEAHARHGGVWCGHSLSRC